MRDTVNHVVVCGYDASSRMLVDILSKELDASATPIVIFANAERPAGVPVELFWTEGDPTKESELEKVNIARASAVIVAGSRAVTPQVSDAISLLTLFTIRSYMDQLRVERKKPLYVVAEILDSENVQHARTAGADEVIETFRVGYSLLAHTVAYPGTADTLSRVVIGGAHNLYVGKIPLDLPEPRPFNQVMHELRLGDQGVLVVGVRSGEKGTELINPPRDHLVDENTVLL